MPLELAGIRAPTLLVAGDADERSPLTVARALNAAMTGSEFTVLPGLGHECYLDDPKAFDAAVHAFLRQ